MPPGSGTDVAIESAGIVLASDDPHGVLKVLRLSRAAYRRMLQNLEWATGYNLVGVPVVGAVLMSASTIVVALDAQLLRRLDLR